jgi:predicted dehydrogenase
VVCSVRVDKHFAAIAPALKAGKNVYVEWPLGKNLEEAEELLRLSKAHCVKRTVVGLQGRFAPSVWKLKELIKDGKIGNVLSSAWVGYGGNGGPTEPERIRYMLDKKVGGNLLTIHFGHAVDYIQQGERGSAVLRLHAYDVTVLGTFKTASGIVANRRPLVQLLNKDGSVAVKDFPKTIDDTIFVHGIANNDTPVSINLRGGGAFKGTPGQDWRIYGEKGEIRLTASGPFLQVGYPDITIAVHDFASNEVEEIEIDKDPFDEFSLPVRNVARVYEAIAADDTSNLCDFGNAVEGHRLIDTLYKANSTKL